MRKYKIGIVGATGLVSRELIQQLEKRNFPVKSLKLFTGFGHAGERIEYQGEMLSADPISADYYKGLDIVFFATHQLVSRDLAEQALNAGAFVLDASRHFRLDPQTPLVVPEVNPETLEVLRKENRIIASPGPATIALSLVLAGIENKLGIKRLVVFALYGTSYQGRAGLEEHQNQTLAIFNQQDFEIAKFPRQIAFNIFPQVGRFIGKNTEEEDDIELELKKIFKKPELVVNAICAYAPVFAGISIMLFLETENSAKEDEIRDLLSKAEGILLMDEPEEEKYPDILACMESDDVLVGRIRAEKGSENKFRFYISSDNLRKGSSLNLIQIAEKLIELSII